MERGWAEGDGFGGENGGFGSECQKCCERHRELQFDGSPCRIEPAELRPSEPTSAACRLNSKSSFILRQIPSGTDRWILASRRMTLLGLCGRVLLHAGGASFSRKHALVQCTGLLNKTSLVTVGGRLRESYDFAHLISRERYARRSKKRISCQPWGILGTTRVQPEVRPRARKANWLAAGVIRGLVAANYRTLTDAAPTP
jgi:hypothetical protein